MLYCALFYPHSDTHAHIPHVCLCLCVCVHESLCTCLPFVWIYTLSWDESFECACQGVDNSAWKRHRWIGWNSVNRGKVPISNYFKYRWLILPDSHGLEKTRKANRLALLSHSSRWRLPGHLSPEMLHKWSNWLLLQVKHGLDGEVVSLLFFLQ